MLPKKEHVWSMCVPALSSWKGVTPDSITFQRLLGMSNMVLGVSICDPVLLAQGITPTKVLLRVYPTQTSRIICREKEQAIFAYLSETDHGVKMYYSCPLYRIEEFIEGEKLTIFELGNKMLIKTIAQIFSEYHHDPLLSDVLLQFDPKLPFAEKFLTEWYTTFKMGFATYMENVKSEDNIAIMKSLQFFATPEFEKEYRTILQGLSGTEIVTSHCDVHEMNMLRNFNNKEKIILIDFEYSTFNYRAIDIATLWVETTIDYTHPIFPFFKIYEANKWDEEDLTRFIRAYLERDAILHGKENVEDYVNKETPLLTAEVKKAEPLVSALWAVWAIIMVDWKHLDESKDWNFAYAMQRFGLYEKSKKEVLKTLAI